MSGVENNHHSPLELKNVTIMVNKVSSDHFESIAKKKFFLALDAIINRFLKIRNIRKIR